MKRYLTVSQGLGVNAPDPETEPPASFAAQLDALHTSGGGLVAHWPLADLTERLGGLTLTAGEGSHETGLPALAAGGTASRGFNGLSTYAYAAYGSPNPTNAALVTAAGTIGVLIQADQTIGKMNICNLTDDGPGGVSLELLTGGVPRAFRENTSSTPVIISGGQLIRGRPYLYALTWGAGGLLLYLMGADRAPGLVASNVAAVDWTPGVATGQDLYVGRWHGSAVDWYDGLLSHLFWFSRQLTIAELESLAVLVQQVAYLPSFNFGQVNNNETTSISLVNRGHPPFDFTLERTTPNPTLGTATVSGTSVNYAAGGTLGADSFGVILTTAEGLAADPCTVSLSVVPPPTPVAHPDSFGPFEAGSSTDLDVLANDENVSGFDIAIVSQPAAGSLTRVDNATASAKLRFSAPNPTTQTTYTGSYSVDGSNTANVSVTVNALSSLGSVLSVPKIEFLVSDETTPSATKFVSSQNRGNGSGSSAGNAQELQAALNGASPGQTFVAVSQTPGTVEFWDYPDGISFPSGSSGNFITLQARQGDGVVISAAEDFAGARAKNSGFWTQSGLSGSDVALGIWKSTQSFGSETTNVLGVWYEFDHPHFIVPTGPMKSHYTKGGQQTPVDSGTDMERLRAPYISEKSCPPHSAAGPCLHLDNGTLYLRWIRPHPSKYSAGNKYLSHLWPGHPEAVSEGRIVYPISLDPNNYVIHIYRADQTTQAFNMSAGHGGGFVKIGSGINSLGYRQVIHGHDITMRRGTDIAWRFWLQKGSPSNPFVNYDIQRRRMAQGSQRHLSRDDFKFWDISGAVTGWLEDSYRQSFIDMHSSAPFSISNINFKDCTLTDWHEWAVARFSNWRFRNCTMFNLLDDGFQCNPVSHHFEIGYCYLLNTAFGGNGGSGTPSTSDLGLIYFHHNVIDSRVQTCSSFFNVFGKFIWQNHSASGNQPRKNYNNTLLWPPDVEDMQPDGFNHNSNNDNTAAGTQQAHEVFNNLFIRHDTQRYIPTNVGTASTTFRSDQVGMVVSCSANESNEFWDYNVYYRDVPLVSGAFRNNLLHRWRSGKGVSEQGFATLAAFRASALFTTSKSSGSLRGAYAPGFEANGTDTKPTLLSLDNFPADRFKYRPSPTSVVTVATTSSLSGANWWSTPPTWGDDYFAWNDGERTLAPSNWKGALDPSGSTMPVGVQNP